MSDLKKVVLAGRANVGKSLLFNMLCSKRHAIVSAVSGLTRDYQERVVKHSGKSVVIVDTGGFQIGENAATWTQTKMAIDKMDLCLFLIDSKEGITVEDIQCANYVRRCSKPTIVVANKCENAADYERSNEAYRLGFDKVVRISSAHNDGVEELLRMVMEEYGEDENVRYDHKVTILGRPNVGKSTLINSIVREHRLMTSDVAGTTRDSVPVDFLYESKTLQFIDTAGMRRSVTDEIEKEAKKQSIMNMNFSPICVLVVDATNPLRKQDLSIASDIIDEGRIIILLINKWDLVKEHEKKLAEIKWVIERCISQVCGLNYLPVSAIEENDYKPLIKLFDKLVRTWSKKISTPKLNKALIQAVKDNPPPMHSGRRIKIKYVVQKGIRPPEFLFFISQDELPVSYERYLRNRFVEEFGLYGIPVRMSFRVSKNPYAKEK